MPLSTPQDLEREGLTRQQAAAAADVARAVLCIACAGSGKSQTLAYRIARLVSEGVEPSSIVAITFTEKAADSIKRRVATVLQRTGLSPNLIGQMYIGTIHAFCQNVLGDSDAVLRQYDVLDDNRFMLFLMSRYPELHIAPLRARARNAYFETLRQVKYAWNVCRDEGIDLASVSELDPQLGQVLQAVEACLQRDQFLDFATMVRSVADKAATDPRVRARLARVCHLLVDEYQDVSGSQEMLVERMHALGADIFVVGDDDQSIYGFRGAHVTNILQFTRRYAHAVTHVLSVNFRSTRAIVDASANFVAAQLGPERLHKQPEAHVDLNPRQLGTYLFDTRPTEAEWVARRIRTLLGTRYEAPDGSVRGLTPGDFAILMRSTKYPEQSGAPRHAAFTSALAALGIDFTLGAGGSVFDRPVVAALRATFELLATGPISRPQADALIRDTVAPAYPAVNADAVYRVLADWGRRIHAPLGAARQRLFPQALLVDLLDGFGLASAGFNEATMREIGLFSRMLQDVEAVYLSIDSEGRFTSVVRFLQLVADSGYDVTTDDVVMRPDAVTVSTVHQVKGLEFPVVFVVDVVPGRFPGNRSSYDGWLPQPLIAGITARGAYVNTPEAEARLFYTALTRAERYLYVSGVVNLPGGRRANKQSRFSAALADAERVTDPDALPVPLPAEQPRQRIDEATLPTSFSDVRYYLRCPMDYRFRKSYGFSPPVPELFGYGRAVHVAIQKLHDEFPQRPPTRNEAAELADRNFHLKHVAPSRDPVNRPGAYERAREKARDIAADYADEYRQDFAHQRQVEVRFEIPAQGCLITGSIDLLMRYNAEGGLVEAHVVDFKAMEGGEDAVESEELDWRTLSLQVQLYAKAAREVLGQNAATGSIHLLKDNQRITIPIDQRAVDAAIANVEWAVAGILAGDFPMRPEEEKCENCDFSRLCPKQRQEFRPGSAPPPAIHTPSGLQVAAAI
jgi:DNA helicase II / ATP-dependent DNA helicase PcrA